MKSSRGSKGLTLDRNLLAQLLGSDEFYRACPAYFFLKDQALAAHAQFQTATLTKPDCGDCGDAKLDPLRHLQGPLAAFTRHTLQLFEDDPANLGPLRAYLEQKLGYKPKECVLYYVSKGRHERLIF